MNEIKLVKSEKNQAGRILARSFFDYPMIEFCFPEIHRTHRYLEWYFGCVVNYGLMYGEVYKDTNFNGVAIWLPPGQTHLTTWRYLRSGFLLLPLVMGIKIYFSRAEKNDNMVMQAHEQTIQGPHWYL